MKKFMMRISLLLVIGLLFTACESLSDNSSANDSYLDENELTTQDEIVPNALLHKTEVPAGYIGIYTVEDLKNAEANADGNYILMNDLDLSSVADWDGIYINGIFDGNNYSIRNLQSTTGGLFTKASSILNVNLQNVNIRVVASDYMKRYVNCTEAIGGIVDVGTYVDNCTVSGEIQFTLDADYKDTSWQDYTPNYGVGGLVGSGDAESNVTNCVNNAKVIVENKGKSYYVYAGGIVGSGHTEVSNCINYGEIHVTSSIESKSAIAGGICGEASFCYHNCNYGGVFSTGGAGGIVGYARGNLTVDSCFNSGEITGLLHTNLNESSLKGSSAGGIIGFSDPIKVLIKNSYNVGKCAGANSCGGIVGSRYYNSGLNIEYCAFSTQDGLSITGDAAMFANNKAMSLEEMKELSNYPFTNKTSVWKNGTEDYPYPVFK